MATSSGKQSKPCYWASFDRCCYTFCRSVKENKHFRVHAFILYVLLVLFPVFLVLLFVLTFLVILLNRFRAVEGFLVCCSGFFRTIKTFTSSVGTFVSDCGSRLTNSFFFFSIFQYLWIGKSSTFTVNCKMNYKVRFALAKVTIRCENTRQTSWWVFSQSCSHSQPPGQRLNGGERKTGWTQNLSEFYELLNISNFNNHLLSLRVESCSLAGWVVPAITSRGRKNPFLLWFFMPARQRRFSGKTLSVRTVFFEKNGIHTLEKKTLR